MINVFEQISIRAKTTRLVKKGLLKLPKKCKICGTKNNLHIHHKKYTVNRKDLDVLCHNCHKKIHSGLTKEQILAFDDFIEKKGLELKKAKSKKLFCRLCGYVWISKLNRKPTACANCRRYNWDKPRVRK